MPNTYTPELVSELRQLTKGMPRATGVKAVRKKLGLSERQGRAVYSTYIEGLTNERFKELTQKVEPPKQPVAARKIRRLFWDIETSPNIVLSWRVGYKLNIDSDNILKERAIICIGWKWEHEKEAHILHWDVNQDDKAMLTEFLKVANEADEMVAHNGDQFDMAWFKTRCLFHGLIPLPDYKTVDTLQIARRKFYFNSNKLNYIAKFLGLGGKIKTEFGLWKEIVLNKCPKSMKLMCDYCKRDVVLLEQVWARLSQLVAYKTHAGVLAGGEKWSSPKDGNTDVVHNRAKVTASGTVQHQMRDKRNGIYFTINQAAYEAYLAAKPKSLAVRS